MTIEDSFRANQDQFEEVLKECASLRWRKMQDYGLINTDFGELGILVRVGDKYERIKRAYLSGRTPNYESVEDSLIDLINYSTMLIMEIRKKEVSDNEQEKRGDSQ